MVSVIAKRAVIVGLALSTAMGCGGAGAGGRKKSAGPKLEPPEFDLKGEVLLRVTNRTSSSLCYFGVTAEDRVELNLFSPPPSGKVSDFHLKPARYHVKVLTCALAGEVREDRELDLDLDKPMHVVLVDHGVPETPTAATENVGGVELAVVQRALGGASVVQETAFQRAQRTAPAAPPARGARDRSGDAKTAPASTCKAAGQSCSGSHECCSAKCNNKMDRGQPVSGVLVCQP